jgi:hypothetical protein
MLPPLWRRWSYLTEVSSFSGGHCISLDLYSKISPGWHSSALQIASRVDSRIAFTLPFFKTETLAIVMPTLAASSVTLIFRFANITSMLIMIATPVSLYRQVVFGFYIHGILQNPLKHRRCGRDNDRAQGDEDAHKNPACAVITIAQHNEKFSYRNKADNG